MGIWETTEPHAWINTLSMTSQSINHRSDIQLLINYQLIINRLLPDRRFVSYFFEDLEYEIHIYTESNGNIRYWT